MICEKKEMLLELRSVCPISASSVCVMELYVLDIQCVLGGGSGID